MEAYRKRAKETSANTPEQEESKQSVEAETPAERQEAPKEPEVDVEAIKEEAFNNGFGEGRRAGYEQGNSEGYKQGEQDGYARAKQEQPEQPAHDPSENLRTSARYATVLMVLPYLFNPMFMMDPNFRLTNHFTESELELLKQLFAPSQPYFSPQFDFSKLGNDELVGALDKATNDAVFMSTVSQVLPMTNGYMMNFGAYGQGFGGNVMAQPMPGQVPVNTTQAPAPTPVVSQPAPVQNPVPTPQAPVEQETQPEVQATPEPEAQEGSGPEPAEPQEEQKKQSTDIWNQHDDDDDEEDHEDELDHQADEPEDDSAAPADAPAETTEATEGTEATETRDGHHRGRRGNRRGGRYNNRGGRYRQNYNNQYNDYNEEDYKLYENDYNQGYQQNNYRGGNRRDNNYDGQKRDYYGKPHRAGRGRGARGTRGNRGGKDYGNRAYHEEKPAEKKEQPKFDEDGFEINYKKTYTKPAKRGRKPKGAAEKK